MVRTTNRTATDRAVATAPAYESVFAALLRRGSFWVLAAALVYACELMRAVSERANQVDFSHYYVSALAMRQGIDPYTTDLTPIATSLGLDVEQMQFGTYPPTFVLCFEPLTLLPPLPAYWVWTAMNMAFFAVALYLLLDGLPGDSDLRLALAGLAILYAPVTEHFFYAQTQILILLLLALFLRWYMSARYALAGLALAFAVLLKAFPLILVGYLVLRRDVKAIAYTGLVLILGGLLTFALVGVETSVHFLRVLPFLTNPYFLSRPGNISLAGAVSHVFWLVAGNAGSQVARKAAVVTVDVALLVLTARATLRSSKLPGRDDEAAIALWVVTSVIVSPTAWRHYLVLFLLPFAVMARQHLRGEASPAAAWLAMASYAVLELEMVIYLVLGALIDSSQQAPVWLSVPPIATWYLALVFAYAACYLLAAQRMPAHVPAASAVPVRC